MTSTIQTRGWKGQHHDADVRVFAPRQVDRLAQDSDAIGVGVRVDAALSQVAVPVASTRCSVPSFIMTVGMHPSLGSILPFQIRECATTAVFRQDISRVLTREDGRHVAGRFGCTVLLKRHIRQNQTDANTPRVSSTHKALQAIAGRSLDNFQSSHACEMEREGTRQCSSPESCNHYSPPTLRRRLRRQQRWLRGNAQERSPKTAHGAPRLVVLPLPAAHP